MAYIRGLITVAEASLCNQCLPSSTPDTCGRIILRRHENEFTGKALNSRLVAVASAENLDWPNHYQLTSVRDTPSKVPDQSQQLFSLTALSIPCEPGLCG